MTLLKYTTYLPRLPHHHLIHLLPQIINTPALTPYTIIIHTLTIPTHYPLLISLSHYNRNGSYYHWYFCVPRPYRPRTTNKPWRHPEFTGHWSGHLVRKRTSPCDDLFCWSSRWSGNTWCRKWCGAAAWQQWQSVVSDKKTYANGAANQVRDNEGKNMLSSVETNNSLFIHIYCYVYKTYFIFTFLLLSFTLYLSLNESLQ